MKVEIKSHKSQRKEIIKTRNKMNLKRLTKSLMRKIKR